MKRTEILKILIKTYNKDVVMDQDYVSSTIEGQMDFEILEYFIGAPDFVFQEQTFVNQSINQSVGFLEYTHKMLNKFMEKKSWENALRYILVNPASNIFNSVGGCIADKTRIFETIVENVTDFSYVDARGTKFVNAILEKCLSTELFKQIDENIVKKLLDTGAEKVIMTTSLADYFWYTDAEKVEMDIVEKYVKAGVDLNLGTNMQSNGGAMRPIQVACYKKHTEEVIDYLMKHGADINIRNNFGDNALDYLIMNSENLSLIESFIRQGADIDVAFHYAFNEESRLEILRLIMRTHSVKDVVMSPQRRSEIWQYLKLAIEREMDFDVLEYLIEAPNLGLQNIGISVDTHTYTYKMLNQFIEKKDG
eukprot:TRINITY_DN14322_c0_g1_i1.p1 TRINITY_DN14322_c0_g1~~TRINITY_DN14322_c0_g1_i1.p1  ORF type:complete len:365 (+),score=65.37 TRINITY_DN14322_c0_g1_i1:435-1529(+)